MPYDPEKHHRQSTRLDGYDYSSPDGYFVTICLENREQLLGTVLDGRMAPNKLGRAVRHTWDGLADRFPSILLDAFVVMPNHVHGIVFLGANPDTKDSPALGSVMRAFNSLSAIECNRLLGRSGTPFWQPRFHDRIVRDDKALETIRAYIENNPRNWMTDPENPIRPSR
jgi:putative transposase